MAVLARQIKEEHFGLRSMDPMKDLRGVADLIEEAFAEDLDRAGQSALQELRWLSRLKPILWWMIYANPDHTDFLSGFVWEEGGKIVGNITVNRAGVGSRRWLISNLAVSNNFRGRGIGRGLMYAGIELVKEYNGSSVALQVRADNEPARRLYEALHFKEISGTTHLSCGRVPRAEPVALPHGVIFRPRVAGLKDTRDAYNLASAATPLAVQKEWPLRQNQFRVNRNETINNVLRRLAGGGPWVHWVVEDGQRSVALVNIRVGTWGKNHQIELIVHPDRRGQLEKPLLSRALAYLQPWRKRGIVVKHPADHHEAVAAFRGFGFKESQTLVWMKLNL